ncbi:MAG: PAS domain-containing protein [Bacteroidales bacterium]|nr:PAS domain-containing protein [Bacteroidales bacterium]
MDYIDNLSKKQLVEKIELLQNELFREKKDKLRYFIESSTHVFYLLTPNFELVYVSPQIKNILGYTPEEILINHQSFISKNPINIPEKQQREIVVKSGKLVSYQLKLIHKDGRNVLVELREKPIIKNGKTLFIVGTLTEIAKQNKTFSVSHTRFSSLIENIPDLIFVVDAKFKLLVLNKAVAKYNIGLEKNIVGKSIFDIFPYEFAKKHKKYLQLVFEKANPITKEFKINYVNNELFFNSVYSPIKDKTGKVYAAIVVSSDITKQNQEKNMLLISKARYKSLFEDSPLPMWEEEFDELQSYLNILKDKGIINLRDYFNNNPEELTTCARKIKITDVNKAAIKLFRAKNKKDLLDNLDNIFTSHLLGLLKDAIIMLSKGKLEFEAESEIKTLDGQVRQVYIKLRADNSAQNKRRAFLAAIDISKLKKAEEASRKYEHIISVTADHMAFIDKDYIYQAINEASLKAHKKSRKEVIGRSVADVLGADYFREIKDKLDKCLRGENIYYQTWLNLEGYGNRFMEIFYYPYIEKNGNVSGIVVSARDITDNKLAEEELKNHREHLEDLVRIRTEELEEKNKELERFNNLFIGREFRIKELRDKVKTLEEKLSKYES